MLAAACSRKQPQVTIAPAPLDDSSRAALRWVESHRMPLAMLDSARPAADRAPLLAFVGNARVLGVSELTEGTHEFPRIMQQVLRLLGADAGFRGIAVQAPMPEAMDLDRYVRTGIGAPRELLRTLGARWDTQEVLALVEWLHAYDRGRPAAEQIGFFGFELPNATHAVNVVTGLPDSIAGTALHAWLRRELQCVAVGESANWGREGAASDSSFWTHCRVVARAVVDSLTVLGARVQPGARAERVGFATRMARVLQHYVAVGLRHLPREETVAEHVLWLADSLGGGGRLLEWGGDVEAGRLTLQGQVVQSAVPLARTLGDRYRNLAFTIGEGTIRARPIAPGQQEPGGERNIAVRIPTAGSYENMLNRVPVEAFFLDLRVLPPDTAGAWLKGPRPMRLISGVYTAAVPQAFETPLEFPANFDGLLFLRRATPAVRLRH